MRLSGSLIVPAYAAGVVGAFLQISGGFWDVASHILGIPDTFFTASHMILYAGVTLTLLASLSGLVLRFSVFNSSGAKRAFLTGLGISLVGGVLQIVAGPFDFWWHSQYGFDPFLFTPSHSLLIMGIVLSGLGMAVGSVRLLTAARSGMPLNSHFSIRRLEILTIIAMATLWLVLNGLVYLLTDVDGINYTFKLGQAWIDQAQPVAFVLTPVLLAGTGTLVFLAARKTLGWKGAASFVALIGVVVTATANLGFRAWFLSASSIPDEVAQGARIASFIPLYFLFTVPVVLFDIMVKPWSTGRWTIVAASLVAPFASFLDGFYSLVLWTSFVPLVPWLVIPMLVAGSLAGFSKTRFVNALLSSSPFASLGSGLSVDKQTDQTSTKP